MGINILGGPLWKSYREEWHPTLLCPRTPISATAELLLIFSKSLETGKLPGDWKLAEVTAIYN